MPKQKEKIAEKNIKNIKIEEKIEIGDIQIKPFAIPHDAANPCGFNLFKDKETFASLPIITVFQPIFQAFNR